MIMTSFTRRKFIRTSVIGGVAATCINSFNAFAATGKQDGSFGSSRSRVALTTGNNRADMAFRALQSFSKEIARSIGKRRVILKPNNVNTNVQLASTHVDTLEGILEFLKSIGKTENVIIAESAANGPTFDGYKNFGYFMLIIKFVLQDSIGYRLTE
jgi:hypothetical protein